MKINKKRVALETSCAVAEAVRQCNVDVIAAYPITPQTHIVERLSEIVADGELDAEFICVESEHSALSACAGAAAVGARAFTATAGQGLELMHEMVYVVSSMRLPVVMVVCNRALSSPLNIWCDLSDCMAVRDTSWIQLFACSSQEAYDNVICAFKISENKNVLFPVMIHIDGFYLTHVVEETELLDDNVIKKFLPEYKHPFILDPKKASSMGCYAPPYIYTECKVKQEEELQNTKPYIKKVWQEFKKISGREYNPIEKYKSEDAKILFLSCGSIVESGYEAVDRMRDKGIKVGFLNLRLWRPFPYDELLAAVSNCNILIVVDRALSFGAKYGPICAEIKAMLYHLKKHPKIVNFVAGLGGRDIRLSDFEYMLINAEKKIKSNKEDELEIIGVRK